MKLLFIFIILNVFNVIIQTIKSIVTIKCGKSVAAVVNAVAYGLYTVVTVYMLCELSLWVKALVVALCNLVGVYVVKLIEEKSRKDKLWKVECTVQNTVYFIDFIKKECEKNHIPFSQINIVNTDWVVFNFYCATQEKSVVVKNICDSCNAKYFVSESKSL